MTYMELDNLSTTLARHLVDLGIEPEDIVPLCFEKSMWMTVAMLGVLKAGGAFAPMDPEHPRSRHEEIINQAGAKVTLTSAEILYAVERLSIHSRRSERDIDPTAIKSNQSGPYCSTAKQYRVRHLHVR